MYKFIRLARNPSAILIVMLLIFLSGCHRTSINPNAVTSEHPVLLISPEDVTTIQTNAFALGPTISGSIQPELKADLRAEVASVVLQVVKESGEKVKKGDLLVRLDDTSLRVALRSAMESERAAANALEQAGRQYERLKTLRESGMASIQSLDEALTKQNNSQSDLSTAKTKVVEARQQLQRTEIRAPFDGIVSERKVSNGDTAQLGKELIKVINPDRLRFEGLVSADGVSQIKLGQHVSFQINGYDGQRFSGFVKRINPEANAMTRQVEVLVGFSDSNQPHVSGLYAEGQVEVGQEETLMIPDGAFMRNGDKVIAWQVKENALKKCEIVIGPRDVRRGQYVVRRGLQRGDMVIRHPDIMMNEGQKIEFNRTAQVEK